jgi:uncharacterized circularly permuted ATP-grasp superfamily protein
VDGAAPVSGAPAAIFDYNRRVSREPAAAVEQAAWLHDAFRVAGITFAGAPMRSFLRPHLVERAAWNTLRDEGRALLELAARMARRLFDGDAGRLCAHLGIPDAQARWMSLDPGGPDVLLSRLDAFVTPEGPRFIEINSDAPAGFGYGDRMAEVFGRLPLFQEFAAAHAVAYLPSVPPLVEAILGQWRARGGSGAPVVAVVVWGDVKTLPDQEILRAALAAAGARCLLADPRDMAIGGGRLRAGPEAVDVVYRRALLQELVEREDEVGPFLSAYREGRALFVNSFRCGLSEDKAFFGILTDEAFAGLLTDDERELVMRTVPWTRRMEERRTLKAGAPVDLVPFVLSHAPELVLKPAHGYGGQSVLVGVEATPAEWESTVERALSSPWVVQERVAIPREEFPVCEDGRLGFEPLGVNANPFYAAGAEAGAVARASRTAVINVSAGGGSVPTFVLG